MEQQRELLPAIFERTLSLDRQSAGKGNSRALTLFERMAKRLDEIAANTRGTIRGSIATNPNNAKNNAGASKNNGAPASSTRQSAKTSRATAIVDKPVVAKVAKNANQGASKGSSSTKTNEKTRSENGRFVSQKNNQANTANKSASVSGKANALAHERRAAKEQGKIISSAIVDGMGRLGSMLKSSVAAVTQDSDAKDAAGLALGGPFYSAIKEIKDAMPDSIKDKMEERKARKEENRKLITAIKATNGRERDEKGRFKPDANEARRQIAQTEVLEDELLLQEREAKADAKRHKELVKAVKANKRDMLDRFLDRRMLGGGRGRDRVIRDKTTKTATAKSVDVGRDKAAKATKAKSSPQAVTARGPKQKGGLLQKAGRVAGGIGGAAKGTLALGGKAVSGLLRAIPGIGQALALGMAAYEGFQGWNDKELHKQAFGLKDGQEATTGQKASAAAASILDMGGLTSGLLGMLGIEFDKAGVAKSIYQLGSNIASVASGFIEQAGPLLTQVWTGISDFAGRIWSGAQEVGNSIANFATGLWEKGTGLLSSIGEGISSIGGSIAGFATSVWEKGTQFATDIASWAGGAIQQGAGILTGIWQSASDTVTGIWGNLSDFATNALSKAGEMLSGLWEGIKALPGKIMDGVKDLASSAIEGGAELLSKGKDWVADKASSALDGAKNLATSTWDAAKNLGGKIFSFFGPSEAKADELPTDPVERKKVIEQGKVIAASQAVAPKAVEQQSALLPENRPEPMPVPQQPTGPNAIDQLQKSKDADIQNEQLDNLEELNKSIREQTKMLNDQFQYQFADTYGIAGAMQGVASSISSLRSGNYGGGGSGYGGGGRSGGGSSGGGRSSFAYNPDSKIGDTIAKYESGNAGVHKIGYDRTGGTSYGKWQLASKTGSYEEWLQLLESKGGKHADIAAQLRAAGPTNTGSRTGQHVDVYKKLAAENAQLFEDTQRESLLKNNYNPAMQRLSSDNLRQMIQGDKSLQEMMFSTSVQHGGGGAAKIFNSVYKDGMSRDDLIKAVYARRGGQFGSSTAQVQASVRNRFKEEQDLILGMNQGEANAKAMRERMANGGADAVNAGMSSMVAAATQKAMDDGVKYKMGGKNSANGEIDCSGWVQEMGNQMMSNMNQAMGDEVFSKEARNKFNRGAANEGAAGIIRAVSDWNGGQLLTNDQLSPDQAREGMVIGLSKSGDSRVAGRFKGIGHIVQTYRDPETGELMVSESRGGKGVMNSKYSDWYAQYQKKGYKMYGSDLSTMADASKVKPAQPAADTALAENAQNQNPPEQLQANAQAEKPQSEALAKAKARLAAAENDFNEHKANGYTEASFDENGKPKRRNSRDYDFNETMAQDSYKELLAAREEVAKLEAEQAAAVAQQTKQPQPTAIAEQAKTEQPVQSVATAQQMPTQTPASIAAAQANFSMATPKREPIEPEAVREIDPEREMKGNTNDNGPLLKIMGQILAAIEDGNKKLGSLGKDAGDGPPAISTEYDNPAAQGMAMDSA